MSWLLDLIYPRRCLFCDCVQPVSDHGLLCDLCRNQAVYVGKAIDNKVNIRYVDECYSLFVYEKPVSDAILALKFSNRPDKGVGFGTLLAEYAKINIPEYKEAVVVDVPLGKKRKKERRYNQSTIMARQMSKVLQIDFLKDAVIRIRETKAQSTLGSKERMMNIKGCFYIPDPFKLEEKVVIIPDDVVTTGSTMNELSQELKKAGAKKVIGITVATSEVP